MLPRSRRFVVLALFFVSGATGLVYQGIWFRELQALFGVTTHALAIVVAAFMGGLAAGSWAFGRVADRSTRPLWLYGVLEIGVAVLAPLVAPCIGGIERLYVALHPHVAGSLLGLSVLRLVLALLVLLAPTLLMGGTLPALTVLFRRSVVDEADDPGVHRDLGALYGINTLGAVTGAALVGFVLLVHFGLLRTTLATACVQVGIGGLALWLGRARTVPGAHARAAQADQHAPHRGGTDGTDVLLVRYAILVFAISGGVSLAYEVAWTRVLAQIIGSSTYAFSMILAGFLLGLGAGSLVGGRLRGRHAHGLWGFALAELAIGATAALVVPLFVRLPDLQLRGFASVQSMGGVLALQFALCLAVVLLPTLAMGATFPLVAGFVARRAGDVGRDIGRLYAGNTVGGIAGSMLAGFVALPWLGTQHTLLLAIGINLLLALVGFALLFGRGALPTGAPRAATAAAGLVALAVVVVALRTPAWDPYVLDAGIAVGGPATAHGDPTVNARDIGSGSEILFYREGLNATISVRKDEVQYYLKTNGKTDGTSRGDMPTQLMLGLLPSLVHSDPRRTLVIGLGTGATARAALVPPVERLDVVEIEPAVVEAARTYFGIVNRGLFDDPRTHLWVDDARAFLLTSDERYDLIVSEPSNPWIAGVANLFSVDHYRRCAERLAPDGIVTQWLQTYAMRPELVRMVLASMHEVFPHLAVWSFHYGDLLVLGSRTPLPGVDVERIAARMDGWELRAVLRRVLDLRAPSGLQGFELLGEDDVARLAAGAALNTEDRPRLEFAAPFSLYLPTREANAAMIRAARRYTAPTLASGVRVDGVERLEIARAAFVAQRNEDAEEWVETALADPATPRAAGLALGGETAIARRQAAQATSRLEEALRLDPGSRAAARSLALLRILERRIPEALPLVARACAPDPDRTAREVDGCIQLLDLLIQHDRAAAVAANAESLLAQPGPAREDPVFASRLAGLVARAAVALRQPDEARAWAQRALDLNAQSTAAWRVFGILAFESQQYAEAIGWWERCVSFRQSDPELLLPLAIAYQRTGHPAAARRLVTRVLARDPQNSAAARLARELG